MIERFIAVSTHRFADQIFMRLILQNYLVIPVQNAQPLSHARQDRLELDFFSLKFVICPEVLFDLGPQLLLGRSQLLVTVLQVPLPGMYRFSHFYKILVQVVYLDIAGKYAGLTDLFTCCQALAQISQRKYWCTEPVDPPESKKERPCQHNQREKGKKPLYLIQMRISVLFIMYRDYYPVVLGKRENTPYDVPS